MPEGFEIFKLSLVLNQLGYNCKSYGKHLYFNDSNEDWTFGLNGTVNINSDCSIEKNDTGFVTGDIKYFESFPRMKEDNKLGVDLITGTEEEINEVIMNVFQNSRQQLGILLLKQSHIAGIGVAWGSEMLARTEPRLLPNVKAKEQDLRNLARTIVKLREDILELYKTKDKEDNGVEFVQEWFRGNLYKWREPYLIVYKKSKMIKVGGRSWWIV